MIVTQVVPMKSNNAVGTMRHQAISKLEYCTFVCLLFMVLLTENSQAYINLNGQQDLKVDYNCSYQRGGPIAGYSVYMGTVSNKEECARKCFG